MDRKKFNEGMAILCEQFDREPTELLLKGYWMVLRNLTNDEFEHAVMSVMSTKKYNKLPLAAELLEVIHGNPDDRAQIAVNKIEAAIPKYGNGHADTVVFDDPYIHATIASLGGWLTVSDIYWTDEWSYYKHGMLNTYKALSKSPIDKLFVPEKLEGWHDRNNRMHGHDYAAKVYLIGNEEDIMQWTKQIASKKEQELIGGRI